jgi:pimeloyl-[acyl-carrier protein] methyl ester esterase
MGGMVALEAASRWPELFAALVVVGGTARFTCADGYDHGVPDRTVRAMKLGVRGSPTAVLSRFFAEAAAPAAEEDRLVQRKVEAALSFGTAVLSHGLAYLEQTDLREQLDRVVCPTLILHGSEDRIIPWQAGRFLAGRLKRSRFKVFDGVGHTLPLTAPAAVASEVRTYLEEWS